MAVGVEYLVGDDPGQDGAKEAGDGVGRHGETGVDQAVTLLLLQVEHGPGAHGVAGHVHAGAGGGDEPDDGLLEYEQLGAADFGRIHLLGDLGGFTKGDGRLRQGIGLRAILQHQIHAQGGDQGGDAGADEAGLPAEVADDGGGQDPRDAFPYVARATPD